MAQSGIRSSGTRRTWRAWAFLGLSSLLLVVVAVWARKLEHDRIEAEETSRLSVQARAIEVNLARQLAAVNTVLMQARADLAGWPSLQRPAHINERLGVLQLALPGVRAWRWQDASGQLLAASERGPGQALSARDAAACVPTGGAASVLHACAPLHASGDTYTLVLSLAVPSAAGAFDGTLLAALDTEFFSTLFQSVRYAPDMRTALIHDNGQVVMVSPKVGTSADLNLSAPGTLFSRHRQSGQVATVQTGLSRATGDERVMVLRTLQAPELHLDAPLVLTISRSRDALYNAWAGENTWLASGGICLFGLLTWGLATAQRRRDEAEQQAAAARSHQAAEAQRLALALRGADLALWDLDVKSGVATVNDRWATMLGYKPGGVSADTAGWQALLHPEDRDRVVAAQEDHLGGRTAQFEATYRMQHREGHWIWVLDRGRVVERDAAGQALRMVGTHMDISDRMQAEESLRRSQESLAITLHSMGDGVIATDGLGIVTRMNDAGSRLTGWPAAEAVGRPLRMVYDVRPVEGAAGGADPVARVLEGGETVGQATGAVLRAKDGFERRIAETAAPIRDGQGRGQGMVLVFSDVTEHHRMLQELRDREVQLRNLADALPGPLARLDMEGRYRFANAAYERWFGIKPVDMLGKRREEVLPPAVSERVSSLIRNAAEGVATITDVTVQTLQGTRHTMVTLLPDRDSQGEVVGVILATADLTERKQAEQDLRASEGRRRIAGRLARLGGWRLDVATGQLWLPAEIEGLLPDDQPGPQPLETALERLLPEHRALLQARIQACVEEGESFDLELGLRAADGRVIQVRMLGEARREEDGRVALVQGALQDVTESRREQQQLRLLQASVAHLNDVVVITEADPLEEPGPRIVFVNEAFQRVTGWPREAVIGRSPRFLRGPLTDVAELARIDGALQHHQAVRAELQHYNRKGAPFWVQIEIVPLFGADGRPTHLVSVHRDITERKRAEAAAQAAQRELADTLAAVPDLLFDIDIEGRVHGQHSPRSDLLLVPLAEQIGRTVTEVLPPAAASVILQGLREAEATGSSAGLQYELPIAGQSHWFEMSVSRKAAAGQERARFVMLARDITERKQGEAERRQLERHLREAQKMESIGTLAGGIAHDFNNILAAILGNVALAQGDLPAGHPAALSLQQINRAGLRARSLVQQILTFSRRQPQALEVQAIGPVVEETLALLRATLPAGVRLETRLSAEPLRVKADATQLQQVLMNLCTNAWHALPDGQGRVEVGLRAVPRAEEVHASLSGGLPGPCVHLWVSDDGAGMDAETRERIFDPFFTTKPVGLGTGLGLSVVHGIVRGHGGALAVESVPGQGSTFHVLLPQAPPEPAGQSPAERSGPGPNERPQTGRQLLYVDDDEVMTLMVQRLLQRAGYRVTVCGEATQALALMASEPARFDLVVSDHNMPGMTGTELAGHLSRLRPGLPIIISSGFITDALREQARHAHVAAVLQKEHTLDELPALVAQVLSRKR